MNKRLNVNWWYRLIDVIDELEKGWKVQVSYRGGVPIIGIIESIGSDVLTIGDRGGKLTYFDVLNQANEIEILDMPTGTYAGCYDPNKRYPVSELEAIPSPDFSYSKSLHQMILNAPTSASDSTLTTEMFNKALESLMDGHGYISNSFKENYMGCETTGTKLNNMMKKLLDKDTQTLVKAGFLNGDLLLTETGWSALKAIVFDQNKAELLKLAEEKIAEDKETK